MPKRLVSRRQDRVVLTDRWKSKGREEGKRWMARAWDRRARKYVCKSFHEAADARLWGEKKAAELQLGLDSAVPATISGITPLFLQHLEHRARSPRHVQQVRRTLERLVEAGIDDLRDDMLPAKLEHWLCSLKQERKGCERRAASAVHRNHLLRIAKSLTRFATRRRLLPYNLLDVIDPLPQPKPIKQVYTVAELRRILAEEHKGEELYTYFALMIYVGCRPSEAKCLRWNHINWETQTITIPEDIQGNKLARAYIVPLPPELADILEIRAQVGRGFIIPERYAEAPSHHGLFKAVKRYLKMCKVEPRKMARHAFRHTCASLLTAIGVPWPEVRAMLNHEDLRVSADYAKCSLLFRNEVKFWPQDRNFWIMRATAEENIPDVNESQGIQVL